MMWFFWFRDELDGRGGVLRCKLGPAAAAAVAPLKRASKDKSYDVSRAASDALDKIQPAAAQ